MLKKMKNIILLILFFLSISNAEVKINAEDGSQDDRYGQSVALGETSIFIGANRDFNNGINSGSVYVYSYDDNMSISFSQKLIPSDYSNDQYFGKSISYSNNWLAISAIYDEDNGIKSGAVYVFEYDGESWNEHSKIKAFDGDSFDRFGYSVSINENRLIVGSIYDIVVDLRRNSKTFLKWISFELHESDNYSLHVPKGCANAFLTLKSSSIIHYLSSNKYSPLSEKGIKYNDPLFNFKWKEEPKIISEKDLNHPNFLL